MTDDDVTRDTHPELYDAIARMPPAAEPFRLPDHRYGRPQTRREHARDRIVDAMLVCSVIADRARRVWVHLTVAAIAAVAIGCLMLIASRPGG